MKHEYAERLLVQAVADGKIRGALTGMTRTDIHESDAARKAWETVRFVAVGGTLAKCLEAGTIEADHFSTYKTPESRKTFYELLERDVQALGPVIHVLIRSAFGDDENDAEGFRKKVLDVVRRTTMAETAKRIEERHRLPNETES